MKKTVLIALSALLAFAACQKAPVAQNEEKTEVKEIIFKIAVNNAGDTKAVKSAWADGDKVYVFFSDVTGVKYATLTRSGSDWGATLTGMTASELATAAPANMYAVFFPYEQPVIASDGGFGVSFKTGGHDDAAIDGLSIYSYYMTANSTCTIADNGDGTATITGTLNMAIPAGYVQFFINEMSSDYNEDYRYRLSVDGVKPTACVSYSAGTFGTKELKAAQPMWGYKHGTDGIAFSGVIDATWADDANSHIIYLFDTEAAAKSFTISGKTLASHNTVNFSTHHPSGWSAAATAPTTIEAASLQWGAFNLGATAAGTEEVNYGWYFEWGNIIPVRSTTSAPAGFGYLTYYSNTIAYEALNGRFVNLVADGGNHWEIYDMVKAFLGSSWRLPIGGVSGSGEFYSLTNAGTSWDGYNLIATGGAEDIIFPASGYWGGDKFYKKGTNGTVWSSTYVSSNVELARTLNFDRTDDPAKYAQIYPHSGNARYLGVPVRPVRVSDEAEANGTGDHFSWD